MGTGAYNRDLELFTPSSDMNGVGSIVKFGELGATGTPPVGEYYPHTFWLPSGRGLVAGPLRQDSWHLQNPGSPPALRWSQVADISRDRRWSTDVLVPRSSTGALEAHGPRRRDDLPVHGDGAGRRREPGWGLNRPELPAGPARPSRHRRPARRLHGHRGWRAGLRLALRRGAGRPLGRRGAPPAGRAVGPGREDLAPRARAAREAPSTRRRCCCPTGASSRPATTRTAVTTRTPPSSTSRPTCQGPPADDHRRPSEAALVIQTG